MCAHARMGACVAIARLIVITAVLLAAHATAQGGDAADPASYLNSQAVSPDYTVDSVWTRHEHLPNWEVIKKAAADTWPELPEQFDPAFKNPCWTTKDTNQLKCLPYFQILGVSKCGTTDLYHRLTFHPDFVECAWKGPHFWDESSYPRLRRNDGKYDGSFPAYVNIFNKAAQAISQDKAVRITGEASSNTFTGVVAYLRGSTSAKRINATTAQYLWEAAPWSRFIVLMRDPVFRYYSAYYYYRSKALGPGTPQEFHQRTETEIRDWGRCMAQAGEHACLRMYRPQQLVKGMYATFIPYWLEVWPRSRLMFMRTEDYKAASVEHVQAAATFLGLQQVNSTWLLGAQKMKKRNEKRYPEMLPETKKLLQEFYRPYNTRLVQLLGNDPRWTWGY